jgi:hypothetical protein
MQQIQQLNALDPRLLRVDIEINGNIKSYDQSFYVSATGTKYANSLQNECEVKIGNVDSDTQNYILSATSPFNKNKTPKNITVYAGRKSYGVFKIFSGNVVKAIPSQPPDIFITLKCLTGNYAKGNITKRAGNAKLSLAALSKQVATTLGLNLAFQATDKQIGNYTFSGAALKEIDKISQIGNVSAYIDNEQLIVKNFTSALANVITIVNSETGMVGIPESTEQGIKVKYLLNKETRLGGGLQVTSTLYPALNGNYVIYKLGFDISSREVPFYWIAEGLRQS